MRRHTSQRRGRQRLYSRGRGWHKTRILRHPRLWRLRGHHWGLVAIPLWWRSRTRWSWRERLEGRTRRKWGSTRWRWNHIVISGRRRLVPRRHCMRRHRRYRGWSLHRHLWRVNLLLRRSHQWSGWSQRSRLEYSKWPIHLLWRYNLSIWGWSLSQFRH